MSEVGAQGHWVGIRCQLSVTQVNIVLCVCCGLFAGNPSEYCPVCLLRVALACCLCRSACGVDPSIVKGLGGTIESDVWLLFGLVQFYGMVSACRDSLSLVDKCCQLLL